VRSVGRERDTTVSGYGGRGRAVRIVWEDDRVDVVRLRVSGVFFLSRPGAHPVLRVELLDAAGQTLETTSLNLNGTPQKSIYTTE